MADQPGKGPVDHGAEVGVDDHVLLPILDNDPAVRRHREALLNVLNDLRYSPGYGLPPCGVDLLQLGGDLLRDPTILQAEFHLGLDTADF